MSYRDDFNSSMNSPGGWGGSPGGGFGSDSSKSSGAVYNYSFMPGARPNTEAVGNWNTGGSPFATGTAGGISGLLQAFFNPTPMPQVSAPPQGIASLIPPRPTFPYNNGFNGRPPANYPPTPTPGPMSWPPGSMGHGSTWGGRPVQSGTAPQGSYTRPPGASFGMGMSGYTGMGNDFRSNNFSPSSYPGGDGITSNDIGGGWK